MKTVVCRRELLRQVNGPDDGIDWTDVPQVIRDDEEFRELAEKAKEVHAEATRSSNERRQAALIERLHFLQGKMRSRWCLLIGAPTA